MKGAARLWSWIYASTLIAIGIGSAGFVLYRIINPEFDAGSRQGMVVYELVALGFISFGAVVIGVERILGREARALRPVVKPDEVLVEKYGPRGSHWRGRSKG